MWRFWYPRREDQNPIIGFILLMKGENQIMIQLFYLSDQIKIHRFTHSKRNSKLSSNHDSFFALGWLYTSPGNHHTTEPFTKHHCQATTKHPLPATLSLWLFRRGSLGCWRDGVCTSVTKLQPLSPDLHPHHKKKNQQNNTTKSDEIMLFSRAFQRWLIAFNSNKKLFKSLTALTIYSSFDEIENRCNLRFGCICFNLLSEQCG